MSLLTVAYLGAAILFILSLGGLSSQESARRGNLYGIIGMAIAVAATFLHMDVDPDPKWALGCLLGSPGGTKISFAEKNQSRSFFSRAKIVQNLFTTHPCKSIAGRQKKK